MDQREPATRGDGPRFRPGVSALAFFVIYVGVSIGIHWITNKGLPSGFLTEHLIGGAVATAVYTVLMQWWFRRRSRQGRSGRDKDGAEG